MLRFQRDIGRVGRISAASSDITCDRPLPGPETSDDATLMEGDLGNAGYWYRGAGRDLPNADVIAAEVAALKAEPEA